MALDIADMVQLNDGPDVLTQHLIERCREQDQADHGWSRCVVTHERAPSAAALEQGPALNRGGRV